MVLFPCALLGKAGVAQMVNDGDSWKSSSSSSGVSSEGATVRVMFCTGGGVGVNWWFWGVSLPFFLCQVVADNKSKASGLLVGVGGHRRRSWWVGFLLGLLRKPP